jgi:dsDNA-binding SOS-regulon protein
MNSLRDFLTFEFERGGETYVIDMDEAMDLTDTYNALNTMASKIDLLEQVAASLEFELDEAQSDLDVFVAEQDEEIRKIIGKGEEKIMKAIQRLPGWRKKAKIINMKKRDLAIARGHLGALRRASYLLEVKRNDIRKYPELGEDTEYMAKKSFPIKRKSKRTPVLEEDET